MDNDVIEGFLIRTGCGYDSIDDGMWVIHDEDVDHVDNIVVTYAPPLVLFRVKLMDLPRDPKRRAALYERLLQLNATEMVAGAYGVEANAVVASEALQSENLDYNEFQAAIDGMSLAITDHYRELKQYHHQSSNGDSAEA